MAISLLPLTCWRSLKESSPVSWRSPCSCCLSPTSPTSSNSSMSSSSWALMLSFCVGASSFSSGFTLGRSPATKCLCQ
ncbi:WD repeat domain 3 [Phyllostomus discolor]|uniref:WD repeat domain 3 n=1 Tax=Phyllostomus discolor TaxID=89673 RepID=A0A833YLV5_9CHIR|nr:WD repeat domain 3 [Phyllostomus discolor]